MLVLFLVIVGTTWDRVDTMVLLAAGSIDSQLCQQLLATGGKP